MDVERTEAADAELVRMIERRSRKGGVDPEELEPFYMESVRRSYARVGGEEKGVAPSSPPNAKSAQLALGTSPTTRVARTWERDEMMIAMRIWQTASAQLRLGTLQRKDSQIGEHVRRNNAPMPLLRGPPYGVSHEH